MTESRRHREVRTWLISAHEDLELAESISAGAVGQPRHACFYAQQAVEKTLKAALIFASARWEKVHDLDQLRNRLPSGWNITITHPAFGRLIEYAVAVRYPDSRLSATTDDAALAAKQAREVWDSITADLLVRGFEVTSELS